MPMEERYSDYDLFARIYNRYWGHEVPSQILTVIDMLLVPRLPRGGRILDLCCGTGYIASELTKRGFEVTGLDGSSEMLRYARHNAPSSHFILADARSFELPPVYHGIVSTFDSLNHLMTLEGLTAALCNAYRALAPSGLFLFDMNMEEGFLEHWADCFAIVEDRDVCVLQGAYDRKQRIGRYDITIFRRQGKTWQRKDTTISERCYSVIQVMRALKKAGFREASTHDAEKDLGLTEHAGRTFFLARKDP